MDRTAMHGHENDQEVCLFKKVIIGSQFGLC